MKRLDLWVDPEPVIKEEEVSTYEAWSVQQYDGQIHVTEIQPGEVVVSRELIEDVLARIKHSHGNCDPLYGKLREALARTVT